MNWPSALWRPTPTSRSQIEVVPDGYTQSLLARIASGTAGDLYRYGTHYGMANFALRGLYYELDEFVTQDGYDLGAYFEGAIDACKVGGKLYALPVNGHPGWSGLYYLPEVFAEAGVDEPTEEWTYDDMTAAATEITADTTGDGRTDRYGLWVAMYYEATLTPIDAFGGWPIDSDRHEGPVRRSQHHRRRPVDPRRDEQRGHCQPQL